LSGLSGRVPYTVGTSISTCSTMPIIDTATSTANGASIGGGSAGAGRGGDAAALGGNLPS
jgi:hypothetical protein